MKLMFCGCWRRGKIGGGGGGGGGSDQQQQSSSHLSPWNLFIDLKTLEVATDDFSESNLLGQGGFGPVYKGVMEDGQQIAVKKLSLNSRQGVREFTNEPRPLPFREQQLRGNTGLVKTLFQGDDTHVNTFKISGTYGYMAPEYAMNGYLSAKADVFSFGVLVLEIVSGRKNLDKRFDEEKSDLLSYAWKVFQEGKALEIMDPTIPSGNGDEAALCIQIALLCCQAVVSDRPDMNTVHLMLSSDSFALPKPGRPGTRGRVGRWTSSRNSILTKTSTSSGGYTASDTTKASTLYNVAEDYSRNSISVSFTTDGR
ncbi:hypothetical protein OPV22_028208 [Ensete ventricosum]|uniref:Protein kinase domain-containing protein n=1 Tax=Ensete ventricosum TaxID=4639 RepID=A0AAV8PZS2_ENSVE|nr:hypothetical protein OPV22_028208 [Ensete ventricosum]